MRKENPARFSSAVGEAWMHGMFKIKYCHTIFEDEIYREAMRTLLLEAAYDHELDISELGFDDDHLHFLVDIGLYDRAEVAKILKGYTGKKFFEFFPELKRPKNEGGKFWDSGLWNPAYYLGTPKDLAHTIKYIQKQKYGSSGVMKRGQKTLTCFAS